MLALKDLIYFLMLSQHFQDERAASEPHIRRLERSACSIPQHILKELISSRYCGFSSPSLLLCTVEHKLGSYVDWSPSKRSKAADPTGKKGRTVLRTVGGNAGKQYSALLQSCSASEVFPLHLFWLYRVRLTSYCQSPSGSSTGAAWFEEMFGYRKL